MEWNKLREIISSQLTRPLTNHKLFNTDKR